MPSSKFGSKFFGEERYQQYVEELAADGTIGGEQLSPEERKEGFKKRNDKIGFQNFVEKVLEKKQSATVSKGPTALPGGGGGALVKRQPGALVKADKISKAVPQEGSNILEEILKIVTSIRDTLIKQNEFDKKQSNQERQSAERRRRKSSEEKLEGNVFKGLAKAANKVLGPVKGLFERIFDFIKTILIGRFLVKLIDWIGNKDNQRKLTAIGKFLEKTWPALLAAYLLFGNSLGRFITRLVLMTAKFIPKLVMTLGRLALAHPVATAAILAAGGAAYLAIQNQRAREEENKTDDAGTVTPKEFVESRQDKDKSNDQTPSATQLRREMVRQQGLGMMFSEGGLVPYGFSGGGMTPMGTDTVPAMLTPGEFVMSRGAVQEYGADTLASMNAVGGGTNRPRMLGGTVYASGGGQVHESERKLKGDPETKNADFDPEAASAALSKLYPDVEVPDTSVNVPTITGPTQSGNVEAEKDIPLQLTGTAKERVGNDKEFLEGLVEMSKRLGANPGDMLAKMASESSLMPNAQHPKTLATGLIQMKPETARAQGTSVEALKGMSRAEQLPFIEKFLSKSLAGVKRPISPGHLYTATFLPAFVKEKEDFVIASRDGSLPKGYGSDPKAWYRQNDGLDADGDGRIQIFELGQRIAKLRKDFGISGGIAKGGLTAGGEMGDISEYGYSGSSGSSGGDSGGGETKPFDKSLLQTFDYNKIRQQLGVKTSSVSKPSRPSSSTAAYNQMQQQNQQQGQQQAEQSQAADIPAFDAAAMSSPRKIKTLGITV